MTALFLTLQDHLLFSLIWLTVFGLLVGSFLNVVILRLPLRSHWRWQREARDFLSLDPAEEEPCPPGLVVERSHCPHCGHVLAWWENIPLLSFLILRGKCRSCKTAISFQYPLVEALVSGLFLLCGITFGLSLYLVAALIFVSILVAACGIDFRTQLLLDQLVFPLLWLGLLVAAMGIPGAVSPGAAIAGAAIGYLSLWSVYWAFKLIRGKEGMGYGDFKFLAAIGAWCGPASILSIVMISSIAGALIAGTAMMIQGKDKASPFAFGPFLAIGGLIEFFWRGGFMGLLGIH